ncbi:hypothetical protein BJ085DRAFT_21761 [Dimargaris cristalligena]|uniref:Anaphase-promoting complex subunit 2 n=1 Tax=Dimargaris cristalligena TaxID=215637 RepID=A0A4V1J4Q6_9FUNG|nr:hypothetical protein BJ085DRAFT_21761 [Dimargaris cristalligena]|eukprot:RKP36389.1 hypothetical protein BJ085DRAFT_21761 [Dimargaris cristalligena]
MLLQWMQSTLLPWLAAVTHSAEPSVAAQWEPLLTDQLYQRFGDLRIGELFNIIVEYPDSLPAVEDLRTCLGRIGGKMDAAIALRADVEKRLLQQGANTQDILTQYVSCVKCLRVLDPTSVMAHFVTAPIRTYLRGREDTIKCIVASLVGDDNSVFDDADLTMVTQDADSDDEDNNFDREDWEPEPMDALAIPKSPSQRHADIIGILTNIYDTKDVFAKEYQRILADKLLRDGQASVDNSIKNLELLKLRFGETNIWICEVMVKDITDSKRISQFVHDQGSADGSATAIGMDALVLSHLFWPTFRKETFALPPIVQQAQAEYGELYSRLKPARALHWLPHLGTVDLTIELANRTLDLTVTPLQAAIIHCFSETTTWSLVDLAERLEMALPAVQSKLAYWLAQGVIHEKTTDPLVYEATETSADFSEDSDREEVEVEAASAVESGQDRRVEEMRIYWSFVVGMLTNLGSLPLDRIQAMLHMFVQEPAAYSRSEAELRDFLNLMVKEDKLELSAGMYKLK